MDEYSFVVLPQAFATSAHPRHRIRFPEKGFSRSRRDWPMELITWFDWVHIQHPIIQSCNHCRWVCIEGVVQMLYICTPYHRTRRPYRRRHGRDFFSSAQLTYLVCTSYVPRMYLPRLYLVCTSSVLFSVHTQGPTPHQCVP